jgi:hypothetical protein
MPANLKIIVATGSKVPPFGRDCRRIALCGEEVCRGYSGLPIFVTWLAIRVIFAHRPMRLKPGAAVDVRDRA